MLKKAESIEKEAENLLKKLQDDYQSTISPEQRRYSGVCPESLIWNLFYGKYDFSFAIFCEVLKRLKEDIKN
jgi:hypothetical protein